MMTYCLRQFLGSANQRRCHDNLPGSFRQSNSRKEDTVKKTARLTLALFIFYGLSTTMVFAQNGSQQRQWTLDNGVVRKVLKFTDDYGLQATEWTDLHSNHDFITQESLHPPCDEFSVGFDQQVVSGRARDVRLT